MIDLKLTLIQDDQIPYVVSVTSATLIAAEEHFNAAIPQLLAPDAVSVTKLAWLGWEQTRADGVAVKPFDTWKKTLISVDMEIDTPDPLAESQ